MLMLLLHSFPHLLTSSSPCDPFFSFPLYRFLRLFDNYVGDTFPNSNSRPGSGPYLASVDLYSLPDTARPCSTVLRYTS